MDNLGGIFGVAIAIALGSYFRSKYPAASTLARLMQFGLILLVAAVAGAAGGIGGRYLRTVTGSPSKGDLDAAMLKTKQLPLLGLVITEHPELERKAREAAEAEVRNPTKGGGPDRLNLFGAEIRKQYVVPALRNTDDTSALAANKGVQDFAKYLQAKDVALCYEFGKLGMRDPNKLDSEGSKLFMRLLEAQETAYRTGRTAPARTLPTDEEAGQLLAKAGYNQQDFDMLAKLDKLSDADGCATTVKLISAPGRLPTADGSLLARYLLTMEN
jgi:hypothetical protein